MLPQGLTDLLEAAAGSQNAVRRRAVALSESTFAERAVEAQAHLLRLSGLERNLHDQQVAMNVAIHAVWQLIPVRVFTGADPDLRRLAVEAIRRLDPTVTDPSRDQVRALVVIYKRLRNHHREGRNATSLDLARSDHQSLLDQQHGRCAVCGYEFTSSDVEIVPDDAGFFRKRFTPTSTLEVGLEYYLRNPVLDHILPTYLGGDEPANWQVLCSSCNSGKHDLWSSQVRSYLNAPRRPSDVLKLTPRMRYSVLAAYQIGRAPPRDELGAFKLDATRLVVLPNLYASPRVATRSLPDGN